MGRDVSNPRRANGHRRNQVCARVKAEETHCWICREWVDQTLGVMLGAHSAKCNARDNITHQGKPCAGCVYHPKSPVVDEIVPVTQGGSPFNRGNCRLAHRDCNRTRSDGSERGKTPKTKRELTTSRAW